MKKVLLLTTILLISLLFQMAFAQDADREAQLKAYEQQMIAYRAGLAYQKANSLFKQKQYEQTIDNLKIVEATLDSLETLDAKSQKMYAQTELIMATSYKKLKRYNEAAETFLKVRDHDATNIDAAFQAMLAYSKIDSLEKAAEIGREIVAEKPDYGKVYLVLGNIYKKQEKYDDAIEAYQKGVELQPDNTKNMFPLADLLYDKKKDYAASASIYEKILAKEPTNDKALYFYGVVLEKQGNNEEAITQLKKVSADGKYGAQAKDYIKYITDKMKQNK